MTTTKQLHLVVLDHSYAVCKLPAGSKLPLWVSRRLDDDNGMVSVTQTSDELSIVCRQDVVDPQDCISIERDWTCLKVQGPLDFALTGILASLANPLSVAEISIFAVSTYDTDYIMVKQKQLHQAMAVLREEGHIVEEAAAVKEPSRDEITDMIHKPRDGPAEAFETDPYVAHLVETPSPRETTFGLVLVAGWPPSREQLLEPYSHFRAAVELCFDPNDVNTHLLLSNTPPPPPVYLYPFAALHVTVATLYSFRQSTIPTVQQQDKLMDHWREVVERARQKDGWPHKPLQLEIESAQIGVQAGILLWKETTGGIEAMRRCLQSAVQDNMTTAGISVDSISIPNIIHSSFLRFYQKPSTPGTVVQKRFQENVVSRLGEFFPKPILLSNATLVCERRPYLHVENDARHVVLTCTFGSKS